MAFLGKNNRNVLRALSQSSKLSTAAADPALTRIYGGLKDQDRIFTNLYGEGVSAHKKVMLIIQFFLIQITTHRTGA